MNNFDIVMRDPEGLSYVRRFFQEVRDILQMPHVYFLFLGPRNFFKDVIAKEARVKAIFHQTPILLAPLTKTEIVDALNKRMEILKSDKVARYLRPFKDEVIFQLYDLYQGDLRSILGALKNIASELGDRATEPLGMEEAMFLLSRERWRHVEGALTPEQKLILEYIVKKGQPITQKEIVIHFKKTQANVAHYYFGPFKDHGIIEEIERRGTTKYWYLTKDYEVLKFLQTSKEKIAVQIEEKAHQSSFFE
jgi:Cdc6-like AAA superfamily ATPase